MQGLHRAGLAQHQAQSPVREAFGKLHAGCAVPSVAVIMPTSLHLDDNIGSIPWLLFWSLHFQSQQVALDYMSCECLTFCTVVH